MTKFRFKAGTVLFSGWFDLIEYAHEYIKQNNLTSDDVSLRRDKEDDSVYIVAKKEVELCENQNY